MRDNCVELAARHGRAFLHEAAMEHPLLQEIRCPRRLDHRHVLPAQISTPGLFISRLDNQVLGPGHLELRINRPR